MPDSLYIIKCDDKNIINDLPTGTFLIREYEDNQYILNNGGYNILLTLNYDFEDIKD